MVTPCLSLVLVEHSPFFSLTLLLSLSHCRCFQIMSSPICLPVTLGEFSALTRHLILLVAPHYTTISPADSICLVTFVISQTVNLALLPLLPTPAIKKVYQGMPMHSHLKLSKSLLFLSRYSSHYELDDKSDR